MNNIEIIVEDGKIKLTNFISDFKICKYDFKMFMNDSSIQFPFLKGLYLLFSHNDELLYVGKSTCLWRRIRNYGGHYLPEHINQKIIVECFKNPDLIKYFIIISDNIQLEELFIHCLKPKFNNLKVQEWEKSALFHKIPVTSWYDYELSYRSKQLTNLENQMI